MKTKIVLLCLLGITASTLPNNEVAHIKEAQPEQPQTIKGKSTSYFTTENIAFFLGTGLFLSGLGTIVKNNDQHLAVLTRTLNHVTNNQTIQILLETDQNLSLIMNDRHAAKKLAAAIICYGISFWAMKRKLNKKTEEEKQTNQKEVIYEN